MSKSVPPNRKAAEAERQVEVAPHDQQEAAPASDNQQTVISNRPPITTSSFTSSGGSDATKRRVETIRLGTRLGDIELLEHIGGGGMGQVYRGEDRRLGRPVAVKVLSRDQATDREAVRRFLNEARSAARLNHQSIAQVFSAGESEGHPYIVFEFVEGRNIRSMIEEHGPFSLEEALTYTLQIADALTHAAERRIVHRDVKPSNVLVGPNGQAKLIDLGLARLSSSGTVEDDLTASGVTLGTFDYISPEQARDPRTADSRSDIYSLGCTLFYMLAGRPPFPEGTVLQKLLQHQGDDPPDICQFRPDLPEEVSQVLGKMMAKDPRRRYPDSARLMEALLTLADMIGLHPSGPAQAVWLPPQESRVSVLQRQAPWLAPTVGLACLVAFLHVSWARQDEAADIAMQRLFALRTRRVSALVEPKPAPPPRSTAGTEEGNGEAQSPTTSDQQAADSTGAELAPNTHDTPVPPSSFVPVLERFTSPATRRQGAALSQTPLSGILGIERQSSSLSLTDIDAEPTAAPAASPAARQELDAPPSSPPTQTPELVAIVTPQPDGEEQFVSIEEALAARPETEIVELKFDGRHVESPLYLADGPLTVQASPGCRPVLAFQPSETDPVLCPRDMIHVSGTRVQFEDLHIELTIPKDMPSESWSLFRVSPGAAVDVTSCTLTIRNAADDHSAYQSNVAFFQVASDGPTPSAPAIRTLPNPSISLDDCVARGEATFVSASGDRPFTLTWRNGLLVTPENAIAVTGSNRKARERALSEIRLQNVTAVTSNSFLSASLADHRRNLTPIRVSESRCVFRCRSGGLLHAESGVLALILERLSWNSQDSLVDEACLTVMSPPEGATDTLTAALADWLQGTGLAAASTTVAWLTPGPNGPSHNAVPDDFRLDLSEAAVPTGTVPPGFRRDELPSPDTETAEIPSE